MKINNTLLDNLTKACISELVEQCTDRDNYAYLWESLRIRNSVVVTLNGNQRFIPYDLTGTDGLMEYTLQNHYIGPMSTMYYGYLEKYDRLRDEKSKKDFELFLRRTERNLKRALKIYFKKLERKQNERTSNNNG